ncbi:hypothetical protein KAR34_07710 [bacterium]|nr:hypothetical protein [bacterium]
MKQTEKKCLEKRIKFKSCFITSLTCLIFIIALSGCAKSKATQQNKSTDEAFFISVENEEVISITEQYTP